MKSHLSRAERVGARDSSTACQKVEKEKKMKNNLQKYTSIIGCS